MEDLTKKPTAEIVKDMAILEQQTELLILRYNKLCAEINKRFPQTATDEQFKPKTLMIRR